MTVRELIDKLSKCDPESIVCVEAWASPEANVVKEFETEIGKCTYIGDDLENLEYEMNEDNETPCDYMNCPYDAQDAADCRHFCGLGVDE